VPRCEDGYAVALGGLLFTMSLAPLPGASKKRKTVTAVSFVGDVDGDCAVNTPDLTLEAERYLTAIGSQLCAPRYDRNQDGVINILDIQILFAHFLERC
jgi:hypothetical protein